MDGHEAIDENRKRIQDLEKGLFELRLANVTHLVVGNKVSEALNLMHTWMMNKEAEIAELKTRVAAAERYISKDTRVSKGT